MLKAELEMLEGLKNALNAALIDYDRNHDPEPLYELIEEADALYGADVSEITSALEMAKHYNVTIKCQSMVILRLLQRKYIQEDRTIVDDAKKGAYSDCSLFSFFTSICVYT